MIVNSPFIIPCFPEVWKLGSIFVGTPLFSNLETAGGDFHNMSCKSHGFSLPLIPASI